MVASRRLGCGERRMPKEINGVFVTER